LENDVSLRFEIPCFIDDSRALYESNPEAIKDKLTQKSLSRLPSVTALQKFSTILKVLVVDDSVPVQKSLKRWLEGHGCVVALASNGKVGLKLMREERFDITLMDFLMVRVLL
jgi:PleD family two-component response regulator